MSSPFENRTFQHRGYEVIKYWGKRYAIPSLRNHNLYSMTDVDLFIDIKEGKNPWGCVSST
jgi:hypothetical protein